jgi:tRNA(Ile)-lysidine synthase
MLADLVDHEPGASCVLSGSLVVRRDRDRLTFGPPGDPEPYAFPVEPGHAYDFGSFSFSSEQVGTANFSEDPGTEYVDGSRLGESLLLRTWSRGDWFRPIGSRGKKTVAEYFSDRGTPAAERKRTPILVSGDSIVWICGMRLDDRFKVAPSSTTILKLEYRDAGN